ncbi:AAA family ATPase [Actinospica sp. MGRD01-02]|uniref:AAA family ATPase n=1 Tax=Actinospica acidithermotolerans TaxID=2828514 RepID=A0A941IIZ0_9ACTN|nr:AAA family ATPase [Actinospica acidithermotolerans]MBR7830175.1 AAA family ATPase [Actinospica acidithermotolerans]
MRFLVQELNAPEPAPASLPAAVLKRDSWDDYHFKTSFTLTYIGHDGRRHKLGGIKILQFEQRRGPTPLPGDEFRSLPGGYCALGQSLSFYEMAADLGPDVYRPLLSGLRDVVFDPSIAEAFAEHEGFLNSLERSGSAARAILDASALFDSGRADGTDYPASLAFTFHSAVGGSGFDLDLRFESVPDLPGRANIVIGYNGTGKTRLLANLAMVANADLRRRGRRQFQAKYGRLSDKAIRFGAVIAVSYSAFDTFDVPGTTPDEREQLEESGDVFGYVYCGLRSLAEPSDGGGGPNRLKSVEEVTGELSRSLERIHQYKQRRSLLIKALAQLAREPSFRRAGFDGEELYRHDSLPEAFLGLSTGHKIVLNIVVQLAAYLERKSLLLFDEPEIHLHPPLLAALLRAVNVLLEARDSYAVIATHSPVALQEVPGRYVHVLERYGQHTSVRRAEVETFGENVGYLTSTVFNLDSRSTDYHAVLKKLAERMDVEAIEELFEGGMSAQARAYVESVRRARA